MDRRMTGILGEEAAAKYYRANGYELCAANFRTRQGEVDLIVQKAGCTVFAEVKTRAPNSAVSGAEAVTAAKQRRLILAAKAYLTQLAKEPDQLRFDVVEVTAADGVVLSVHCMENAFGE